MPPRDFAMGSVGFTVLVAALSLFPGCKDPVSQYPVNSVDLRLIPETTALTSTTTSVFVVVELGYNGPDANVPLFTVHARVDNGALEPLPGPALCSVDGGRIVLDAASLNTLDLPPGEFESTNGRGVRETGLVVDIPTNASDVLLTATAYSASSITDCKTSSGTLQAEAFLRLQRGSVHDAAASNAGTAGKGGGLPKDASTADAISHDAHTRDAVSSEVHP
jgi:hypothetical protein